MIQNRCTRPYPTEVIQQSRPYVLGSCNCQLHALLSSSKLAERHGQRKAIGSKAEPFWLWPCQAAQNTTQEICSFQASCPER